MSTSTTKKGFALLGSGIFAREQYLPALAKLVSKGTAHELKAIYSRSKKGASKAADLALESLKLSSLPDVYSDDSGEKADLKALLAREDIASVLIVLPITTQPDIVLAALEAGKHVLSEKPIGGDVKEGRCLVDNYNATSMMKGLVWRVAENCEAEPIFQKAGELVREGAIGKVHSFRVTSTVYVDETWNYYQTAWRQNPEFQGGFVFDAGVHWIAGLRTILDQELTHVSGFASLNKEILKPHDTLHAVAKAGENGAQGTIEIAFSLPTQTSPFPNEHVIIGEKGWIKVFFDAFTWLSGKPATNTITLHQGAGPEGKTSVIELPAKGVEEEIESFFRAVDGEKTAGIGKPEGALVDVAVLQAALTSNGKVIDLKELLAN